MSVMNDLASSWLERRDTHI